MTYQTVYRDARTTHPRDIDAVVEFLRTRFATARNGAEVITIARATQAACLINGNLLAVDPGARLQAKPKERVRQLNDSDLDRLWLLGNVEARRHRPSRRGTHPRTNALVEDRGREISATKYLPHPSRLPATGKHSSPPILNDASVGARETDLFISQPKRTVDKLLTLANRHLNLPIDPSDGRDIRKATQWRFVNGIDFKDLDVTTTSIEALPANGALFRAERLRLRVGTANAPDKAAPVSRRSTSSRSRTGSARPHARRSCRDRPSSRAHPTGPAHTPSGNWGAC